MDVGNTLYGSACSVLVCTIYLACYWKCSKWIHWICVCHTKAVTSPAWMPFRFVQNLEIFSYMLSENSLLIDVRYLCGVSLFNCVVVTSAFSFSSEIVWIFGIIIIRENNTLVLTMIETHHVWVAGLLFLNGDTESLMKLISGLKSASEQEPEVVPIRHVAVLSSMGYLCTPWCIAETLRNRMSMVIFILELLAALGFGIKSFSCSTIMKLLDCWSFGHVGQVFVVWLQLLNSLRRAANGPLIDR